MPATENVKSSFTDGMAGKKIKGCVSSDDKNLDCFRETSFQREHIQKFQPPHEGVSEVSERAREWSERI